MLVELVSEWALIHNTDRCVLALEKVDWNQRRPDGIVLRKTEPVCANQTRVPSTLERVLQGKLQYLLLLSVRNGSHKKCESLLYGTVLNKDRTVLPRNCWMYRGPWVSLREPGMFPRTQRNKSVLSRVVRDSRPSLHR